MSHGESSPCHLSGLLTQRFLMVILHLLGPGETPQLEQSNTPLSTYQRIGT